MRRIPSYLVVALCGLFMFSFGLIASFTVSAQSQNPVVPTVMAMLTQMPPQAVATQLATMGYSVPPQVQATAQAMQAQGYPPDVIIATIFASYGVDLPTTNPGGQPPAAQPTMTPVSPVVQPTVGQQIPGVVPVVPTVGGIVPLPSAQPTTVAPTATLVLPSPTPVEVGSISGNVKLPDGVVGKITLVLTRPDGETLELPVAADGAFNFANMLPGNYVLEAHALNFLSSRAEFTLEADQSVQLPAITLMAGDTNGDNVIDLLDAALIASNFDGPAVITEADLTGDGWVDVRDLTVIGKQFGATGPTTWN